LSGQVGIVVFARFDSRRVPGKALRPVGGIPLLERVIRRAQLLPWPVYLATTVKASDDLLVDLARSLGVRSFRGSEDDVLERAVLAAEEFGLNAFARLCGDRPLFPIGDMYEAITAIRNDAALDLVTTHSAGRSVTGLTTEVVRTRTLRRVLDRGPSSDQREHVTQYLYDHPDDFRVLRLPHHDPAEYRCPSFAIDTESDFANLDRMLLLSTALDVTAAQVDRSYQPQ
jgi:spore coat polysaccharide biosynthesis protein SpsF